MTTQPRHRRALRVAALTVALLALAPATHAAKPVRGATYAGYTAQGENVKLKVAPDGRTIRRLTVNWASACDSGNVLRSSSVSTRIAVSGTGRFYRKGTYAAQVAGHAVHVELSLTGRFASRRRASGAISIHAHVEGVEDQCHVDRTTWSVGRG